MFRYDKRTGRIEDDETGMVLRHGGKPDVDMAAYIFFDPSNLEGAARSAGHLRPGEVQLYAEFIYPSPPVKTEDGKWNWQQYVGYHIDTGGLRSFYTFQLREAHSEKVDQRVAFACRKIREAVLVEWGSSPNNPVPLIDFDGSQAEELTIARTLSCWVLKV